MLQTTIFLAALCGSIFAGAALYVTFVEHPARMRLEARQAALQWAPSYQRGTIMQAPLACVGCFSALTVTLLGGSGYWSVAAVLLGAVVPFTLIAIAPTNKRLIASGHNSDADERAPCWCVGASCMPCEVS